MIFKSCCVLKNRERKIFVSGVARSMDLMPHDDVLCVRKIIIIIRETCHSVDKNHSHSGKIIFFFVLLTFLKCSGVYEVAENYKYI